MSVLGRGCAAAVEDAALHLCVQVPCVRVSGPSTEQRGDGLGEEVCFLQFVFNGTDGGIPVVGRKMCSRFQQVILKDYLKSLLLPPLIEERFCGPFGDGHSPFGHIGLGRQCSGELRGSLSVPQIPPVTQI